jgi:hypothetical protein
MRTAHGARHAGEVDGGVGDVGVRGGGGGAALDLPGEGHAHVGQPVQALDLAVQQGALPGRIGWGGVGEGLGPGAHV